AATVKKNPMNSPSESACIRPISSLPSMKSPKLKRISYVKAGILIVDQVKPAILKGTAVRFDLSKGKGIKWASIFRTDLNDHLIMIASFLNRCNLCKNRCHDLRKMRISGRRECTAIEKFHSPKRTNSSRIRTTS